MDDYWTKHLGFSNTYAVVLELLEQGYLSNKNKHIVWLDNLFTTAPLLSQLRKDGFGAASTVRTQRTEREKEDDKSSTAQQK